MKNPYNGDIKFILKPIKQSNIITQALGKTNIFDIKSVNVEHPKTVTKLSKVTKQLRIITQNPNKIKVYAGRKATDGILEVNSTRHIFPIL